MHIVNYEMIKELLSHSAELKDILVNQSTDLINQSLNFFLFLTLLSILKYAAVFLLFMVIKKFLSPFLSLAKSRISELEKEVQAPHIKDNEEERDSRMDLLNDEKKEYYRLQTLQTIAALGSVMFFLSFSYPHIAEMGKIMIAPKLFLIDKGREIFAGLPKKDNVPATKDVAGSN
jgi:hypothetical protein